VALRARYPSSALVRFAEELLRAHGMAAAPAATTAELLVEADLMGHTTHGLALLPGYLTELNKGLLRGTGAPTIVADRPAVATWDGHYLPGLWLTAQAVDAALAKARACGTGTVVVRRSHHIGCLAAFLPRATGQGMMLILASTDPAVASVAPFGGRVPLYTPNPLAVGIPTDGDPILIDISASVTTNALSARLAAEGRTGEHAWWLDAEGRPTHDSSVVAAQPPGSILPIGGLDHGHKGYALGLMLEALTQGLGGFGRADGPDRWGAAVFVQALDPAAFGGAAACLRQTGWLAEACRRTPPRPGVEAVRVPGDAALARRRDAAAAGVELYPGVLESLLVAARPHGIAAPAACDV
jgi:LDH2 family malate/lactate/ureidoglycolate dehydrogenase